MKTNHDLEQIKAQLATDLSEVKRTNIELDQKFKTLLAQKNALTGKFPDVDANAAVEEGYVHEADDFIKEILEELDTELNDHILEFAKKQA